MYNGILHAHSGLRWIVLLLLVLTVVISLIKWLSKDDSMSNSTKSIFKANTIFAHVQLLLGIVLMFVSTKIHFNDGWQENEVIKFFVGKHMGMMILAVILITVGSARMKRISSVVNKYRNVFIFNLIALIIILSMIPWPFREITAGSGWF